MSRKNSSQNLEKSEVESLQRNSRKSSTNELKNLKPNIFYLNFLIFFVGFGPLQNGFALAGTNLISPVLKTKFDWHHENGHFYIVLLDAAGILGMAIGSLISGTFIKKGRRKTFLLFNLIGIITIIP